MDGIDDAASHAPGELDSQIRERLTRKHEWNYGSEEKRERKAIDLVRRAHAVRTGGWGPYKYTWSTGEVIQVALLLEDGVVLAEFGESDEDVVSRTAFDLYGVIGGAEDRDAGYVKTAVWLDQVRATILANQESC